MPHVGHGEVARRGIVHREEPGQVLLQVEGIDDRLVQSLDQVSQTATKIEDAQHSPGHRYHQRGRDSLARHVAEGEEEPSVADATSEIEVSADALGRSRPGFEAPSLAAYRLVALLEALLELARELDVVLSDPRHVVGQVLRRKHGLKQARLVDEDVVERSLFGFRAQGVLGHGKDAGVSVENRHGLGELRHGSPPEDVPSEGLADEGEKPVPPDDAGGAALFVEDGDNLDLRPPLQLVREVRGGRSCGHRPEMAGRAQHGGTVQTTRMELGQNGDGGS